MYRNRLCCILLIVCIGLIIQTLFIISIITDELHLISILSEKYLINWKFITYIIDIINLILILLFYMSITKISFKYPGSKRTQISVAIKIPKNKHKNKSKHYNEHASIELESYEVSQSDSVVQVDYG